MKLSENQKLNENTRKLIAHASVECDRKKLCKASGVSEATYYRHIKRPEDITLGELRALFRLGKLTDDQLLSAIRIGGQT